MPMYEIPDTRVIDTRDEFAAVSVPPDVLEDPFEALQFIANLKVAGVSVVLQGKGFLVLGPS